ncbi:MAG: extracellular solute-binding protein [Bacteroidota bacterium]
MKPVPFVIALLVLAGCGADDRTPLVVYTPHGKELLTAYEEAFEAEHPDVDVQWLDMGAQNVYDRIRTESARPQASLWWGGRGVDFDRAAGEGLLEAYRPTWAGAIDSVYRHPEHFWYGTYLTPEVITFNTRQVPETEAPSDWDDLLDPKWADRILIRYPLDSGTMRTIWAAMILRQPTIEEGYRWLAQLDVNTKSYTADPTQLYIKLAREEGDVTLWNMPDTDLQAKDNGYPFGYLVPASGTPILTEGIALVSGGPNLDRAKQFYEFVTSKDALIRQANDFHRIPARTDIAPEDLPEWIRNADLRPMPMDWQRIAEEGPDWMQYWDENIKGRGAEYLAGSQGSL